MLVTSSGIAFWNCTPILHNDFYITTILCCEFNFHRSCFNSLRFNYEIISKSGSSKISPI